MIAAALLRSPSPALADGERTHLGRAPIDFERALVQHGAYAAALLAHGIAVAVLPALDDHPDATFVEDAALAFAEAFVLTRPGAASRADEPEVLAPFLPADRPLLRLAAGRLDGGDVAVVGRRVLVGLSSRTDDAGARELANLVEPFGYTTETVAISCALHLKTALTALGGDTLVVNRAWVPAPPKGLRIIDADPAEPFGANLLWLDCRAIGQADAPRTVAAVAAAGFDVTTLAIGEFAKAEAGLTCLSLLIPAAR